MVEGGKKMDNVTSIERLWTVDDVSAYLCIPVETVRSWRKRGYGPPVKKMGKHLRFDPASVRRWATEAA